VFQVFFALPPTDVCSLDFFLRVFPSDPGVAQASAFSLAVCWVRASLFFLCRVASPIYKWILVSRLQVSPGAFFPPPRCPFSQKNRLSTPGSFQCFVPCDFNSFFLFLRVPSGDRYRIAPLRLSPTFRKRRPFLLATAILSIALCSSWLRPAEHHGLYCFSPLPSRGGTVWFSCFAR